MAAEIREYRLVYEKGEIWFPPISELELAPKPASRPPMGAPPLTFQCADKHMHRLTHDVNEWLNETVCSEMYKLYGMFLWHKRQFRIDRKFRGLVIYFLSMEDAVYCRSSFPSLEDYI